MVKRGRETAGHHIAASIAVFLFCFVATTIVLSFFLETWFIVGLGIIIVAMAAMGYLYGAAFGFALGAILWFTGIITGIIGAVTGPFGGFLSSLGL